MGHRAESDNKPWEFDPDTPEFIPQSQQDLEQKTIELAQFLSGAPVDMIKINSIIPSTNFGFLLNLTLGKIISSETNNIMLIYNTDASALSHLEDEIGVMRKKKRKELTDITNNIKTIKEYVINPLNWGPPFNTGKES
jgi:hypothetical protein